MIEKMERDTFINKKIPVAILGSGNIGVDLLFKIMRSNHLYCRYFVGRNKNSRGISIAKKMNIHTSSNSIDFLLENEASFEVVFDATSATDSIEHATKLQQLNKIIINLTPAKMGKYCSPFLDMESISHEKILNMVTCGGQASLPIISAIKNVCGSLKYIEVVSSIASKSAGPATRRNIHEYICNTEEAIKYFSDCHDVKVILNINPALPEVTMKTSIMVSVADVELRDIKREVIHCCNNIKKFFSGYELAVEPTRKDGYIFIMVKITGVGDYFPSYAGNLDIVTALAVLAAEKIIETSL